MCFSFPPLLCLEYKQESVLVCEDHQTNRACSLQAATIEGCMLYFYHMLASYLQIHVIRAPNQVSELGKMVCNLWSLALLLTSQLRFHKARSILVERNVLHWYNFIIGWLSYSIIFMSHQGGIIQARFAMPPVSNLTPNLKRLYCVCECEILAHLDVCRLKQ